MQKLTPALKDYIWGGTRLRDRFGKDNGLDRVSESWEFSVHPDGPSLLPNGEKLVDYLAADPEKVGTGSGEVGILIKFIDALQNLSVQVHPNDAYARKYENDNGKTEMWYILDADEGAGIYCGLKESVRKADFAAKVKDGTVEEVLNFIPVKKGDAFLIEAGTLHAIGKGCLICEIQQSSNVTYRVYDYNRLGNDGKPRALHVDKALAVINFRKFKNNTNTGEKTVSAHGSIRTMTSCPYFTVREITLKDGGIFTEQNDDVYTVLVALEGGGSLNGETFKAGDTFFFAKGESLVVKGDAVLLMVNEPAKE